MALEEGLDALLVISDVFVERNNQLGEHLHLTVAGLDDGWIARQRLSLLDALESLLDLEASIVAVKELSHQMWLSGLQLFQGGPFQKKAGGQIALQLAQDFQSQREDRKSTRLNSSHRCISYAVFCLKKKNT